MRAIRLLGIATILAPAFMLSPSAFAAGSWYGRFDVSYNSVADHTWGSANGAVDTVSKKALGADIAVGDDLGRVWAGGAVRGEFELKWNYNAVNYFTAQGTRLTGTTGHTRVLALMYNLYNDFRPHSTFDPYLGIGIGYADVHYGDYYGYDAATNSEYQISSLADVFAYQAMAGVKLRFSNAVALDLAYNVFVLSDPTIQEPQSAGYKNTTTSYRSNSVTLGLDWRF